jgi:very-short-patch-repair endonuclease
MGYQRPRSLFVHTPVTAGCRSGTISGVPSHAVRRVAGRWLDSADPLTRLLWRQQSVLTRRQALAHLSPKAVEHRIRSGRWQRPYLGIYVAHDGPIADPERLWIAYLAGGRHAFLAGPTAAALCGLRGYSTDSVHVLIPARFRQRMPPVGVIVHRTRRLRREEVNLLGLPPHTTAARSLVDAAQWAPTDHIARSVIAAGFQQRLVAGDEIGAIVRGLGHVRRGALILEAAADAADGAHSLPEAQLIRELRRARLPLPRLQVHRRDAGDRSRYLDGYYEEWHLHIEVDGGQHAEVQAYWKDMRRQNELWIAGDRVLRFPSWAIRHDPAEVVKQVRAALLAAGWRPPT